jgi:hypothetical protein
MHGHIRLKKFKEFLYESTITDAQKALEEIKSIATGKFRHIGFFFGENGMAEIYDNSSGQIKVATLTSFKKGGGRWIMERIIEICNRHRVSIGLLAQSYEKTSDIEYQKMAITDVRPELSQKDLVKWYRRLGFRIVEKNRKSVEMVKDPD